MKILRRLTYFISWTLALKVLLVLVPTLAFFGLLNNHLLLTPTASYTYNPGQAARVISPKEPATILQTANPALRWKLTTDTLPFQVSVPRAVEGVRIRGKLQPGTQPVVWLKAEGAKDADMFSLVSSTFLDSLDWKHVSDGTMTLWMRDKRTTTETVTEGEGKNKKESTRTWTKDVPQYPSIQAFKQSPPDLSSVATLGFDRLSFMNLDQVELPSEGITLPQIFRGGHQFYVYSKGGELKLTFDKIDRNRKKDADTLTIRIARTDKLTARRPAWLKTLRIKDDGNVGGNGPKGDSQKVELKIPNTEPGAYFVDISTSEDVLFTNLASSSPMLAFTGRVFLAEGPAYGEKEFRVAKFLTNGSTVTMAPAHEQGKQEVMIANKKYSLKGVNVDVQVENLQGITSFDIGRPDIKISSDGLLTIDPAKIFPSAGTQPLDLTAPNIDQVDYILAAYIPSVEKDITFDETFSWSELQLQGKRLSFALEMPGLQASGATLALRELKATLIRGPFPWGKIASRIGGLF